MSLFFPNPAPCREDSQLSQNASGTEQVHKEGGKERPRAPRPGRQTLGSSQLFPSDSKILWRRRAHRKGWSAVGSVYSDVWLCLDLSHSLPELSMSRNGRGFTLEVGRIKRGTENACDFCFVFGVRVLLPLIGEMNLQEHAVNCKTSSPKQAN